MKKQTFVWGVARGVLPVEWINLWTMNPTNKPLPTSETAQPAPHWPHPAEASVSMVPQAVRVQARRDQFWSNVVRDTLMAMATAAASSSARLSPTPSAAQHSIIPVADLFDGRMGIITSLGQRIPIADIFPVFACSAVGSKEDRSRSADVQCTIFRITTPTGETYTLPISHIIGIHSLSEDLVRQLEAATEDLQDEDRQGIEGLPFGFGAYTALSRSEEDENPMIDDQQSPESQ